MSAGSAPAPELHLHCQSCGMVAPTGLVTFRQNIGMLVTRNSATVSGELCKRCIRAYFRSFTLTTLFLGWWGVISFVVTPIFIINNLWQFFRTLSVQEAPMFAGDTAQNALAGPPGLQGGNLKLKLGYGAAVWLVVLGILAYNQVAFMEKYFPSLNAKLHSGEITDVHDAEYADMQLMKDIRALNAPLKNGKEWTSIRSELELRRPYLDDLTKNNDRLQQVGARERGKGVGACEQLALDEYVPAVDQYTKSNVSIFALLASTPSPTPDQFNELAALDKRSNDAILKIREFAQHRDARGCSKEN